MRRTEQLKVSLYYDGQRDLSESAPFTAPFDDDTVNNQGLRVLDNFDHRRSDSRGTNKIFQNL
jgi:hypothetical protein